MSHAFKNSVGILAMIAWPISWLCALQQNWAGAIGAGAIIALIFIVD